nr:bZIP transcription factor 44-like [Ipomoea batatas]
MSRSLLPLLTSPEGEKALNSSHHQRRSKVYGGKKKWCVLAESRKLFGIYPYLESGSKGDLQGVMNEMKWKRMQSNCESARWSRMTMVQVAELRNDNAQIVNNIIHTTQHYLNVERREMEA